MRAHAARSRGAIRPQQTWNRKSPRASSPASALHKTGTPSSAAISSVAMASANSGAECSLKPRTWMLPREVTSMTPLPCLRAAVHSAAKAARGMVLIGRSRTRRPSPVGIGADKPGQAPRRAGSAIAGAVMPSPPREAPRGLCRYRCGADARNRGSARCRASRRSRPRPRDFRAAESRALRRRRHRRRR